MTTQEQEWMDRYIYEVTRRLPRKQRQDVALELRELIGDMLEDDSSMERVLTRLGSPALLAKTYQNDAHTLIGPAYYDNYIWLLRIVLLCTLLPVLVTTIIRGVLELGNGGVGSMAVGIAGIAAESALNSVAACLGAFGGVTLVFALLERYEIRIDLLARTAWTPEMLPALPAKQALISRGDTVVGIVFIVLFMALLIFAPQLFSAFFREGEVLVMIPVFHLEKWNVLLPVLLLSLSFSLAEEILRLVMGRYCSAVMVGNLFAGAAQILLSVILLKILPFWNPDFAEEIAARFPAGNFKELLSTHWNPELFSNLLIAIICLATLLEISVTVYKTLRYGERAPKGGRGYV